MSNYFKQWTNENTDRQRLVAEESLILAVTEEIYAKMEELDVSKTQLAQRMGKSKAYVSQLLSGGRNMTLRSLAGLSFALGLNIPNVTFEACGKTDTTNDAWQSTGNVVKISAYRAGPPSMDVSVVDTGGWVRACS